MLVAVVLAAGCGDDEGGSDDDRIRVMASFYPVAEIATRVGGERVSVSNLTPVGVEPHDIELTSRQVDALEDADLVVYLGDGFQPAVEEIAGRRGEDHAIDVLDAVDHDGDDPHFWLDPRRMIEAVAAVTDALVDVAPDDADTFEANATRYIEELEALDDELSSGLGECARREIVTAHAAFSYLAERYELTQLAIAGLSPEAEPDADRLAELSDEIEANGVTTVFYEELVDPEVAETLAREAGVRTAVLSPIEGLTEEQLDAGKGYADVMRDNLAALRRALDCR